MVDITAGCQSGSWRKDPNIALQGMQPGSSCSINMQLGEWYGQPILCWNGVWSKGGQGPSKAWVNFDGTNCGSGYCYIRASYNVANVRRWGTGNYTVYFSIPLSSSSYVTNVNTVQGVPVSSGDTSLGIQDQYGVQISTYDGTNDVWLDRSQVNVSVFSGGD